MRILDVFISFMIFASTQCDPLEQAKAACRQQEGASQADAELFNKMERPVTRRQKCFYACMLEKFGTSDGSRFDTELFLEKSEVIAKNNPAMLKTAREMADRCDGVENEDRCELAAEIRDCLKGD